MWATGRLDPKRNEKLSSMPEESESNMKILDSISYGAPSHMSLLVIRWSEPLSYY